MEKTQGDGDVGISHSMDFNGICFCFLINGL